MNNDFVTAINAKGVLSDNIYIGLAGVQTYNDFWQNMEDEHAVSMGESFGVQSLNNLKGVQFNGWLDCGNLFHIKKAQEHFKEKDFNILDKSNEAIWFIDSRVIKFSTDQQFIQDRCKRAELFNSNIFPQILESKKFSYSYSKIDGEVLSNNINPKVTQKLLDFCSEKLWARHDDPEKYNQRKESLLGVLQNKDI